MTLLERELKRTDQLKTGGKKFKESVELILVFANKVKDQSITIENSQMFTTKQYLLFTNNHRTIQNVNLTSISSMDFIKHEDKSSLVKNRIIIVENISDVSAMLKDKTYANYFKVKPIILKQNETIENVIHAQNELHTFKLSNKKSISLKIAESTETLEPTLIHSIYDSILSKLNEKVEHSKHRISRIYLKTTMGKPIRLR